MSNEEKIAEKESLIFRMEFKDESYIPDAEGISSIARMLDEIFKKGGILILPDKITTEWLKEKWEETINSRKNSGKYIDFRILGALKAVTIERVRLEFIDQEKNS
mgnify:CR=1 FL=1